MKHLLTTLLFVVSMAYTTSCGTVYFDTLPTELATMEIPAEGGWFSFKVVDHRDINDETRFQPGECFKYYRYRVVEDGIASEESENMHYDTDIWLEFAPNGTNHTKEFTIEVKVADDFYRVDEECRFGEWQRVWIITQPCIQSE